MLKNNNQNMFLTNNELILNEVMELNNVIKRHKLVITKQAATELINNRNNNLKERGLLEINSENLKNLILEFSVSEYITQPEYVYILEEVTNIFYDFRQQLPNRISDENIIKTLIDKFENRYFGSYKSLRDIPLEEFEKG